MDSEDKVEFSDSSSESYCESIESNDTVDCDDSESDSDGDGNESSKEIVIIKKRIECEVKSPTKRGSPKKYTSENKPNDESSDDKQDVIPKHKGRPKKQVDNESKLNESSEDMQDVIVKPRGRPKRQVDNEAELNESSDDKQDVIPKHKGRPKKQVDKETKLNESSENMQDVVVKPRGRPKRQVDNEAKLNESSEDMQDVIMKPRGRPKKQLDNEAKLNESSEDMQDVVVKPRGRPKKYIALEDNLNESSEDVKEVTVKRWGRPRKYNLVDKTSEPVIVRPRGRPKKVKSLNRGRPKNIILNEKDSEKVNEDPDKTPKKRGRPRIYSQSDNDGSPKEQRIKTKHTFNCVFKEPIRKELTSIEDALEHCICRTCDLGYENEEDMHYHMLFEHGLKWTKQNPEGVEDIDHIFKVVGKKACPRCDKLYVQRKNLYLRHIELCGRETEKEKCEFCNQDILLACKRVHLIKCGNRDVAKSMHSRRLLEGQNS